MKSVFAIAGAAVVAVSLTAAAGGAFASTPAPKAGPSSAIVYGKAKTAISVDDLLKLIGVYNRADIEALTDAKTVTLYHVRAAYSLPSVLKLERAIGKDKTAIANLQKAVGGNKAASAWFTAQKLNVARLVAVVAKGGALSIYEN